MASVFLGDLDDFITPSQACVNPLFVDPNRTKADATAGSTTSNDAAEKKSAAKIELQSDYTGMLTIETEEPAPIRPDLIKTNANNSATVSLNDCLACSGCVTSAETVLITQQSTKEVLSALSDPSRKYRKVVFSLSPQSRASLAVHYGMSPLQVHRKLLIFFRSLVHAHREGIKEEKANRNGNSFVYLFDTSCSADFSLLEAREEFIERLQRSRMLGKRPLPWKAPPVSVAVSSTETFYPQESSGSAFSSNNRFHKKSTTDRETEKDSGSSLYPAFSPSFSSLAIEDIPLSGGQTTPQRREKRERETERGEEIAQTRDNKRERSVETERRRDVEPYSLLPMMTSACPGWICYAEKTSPQAIPYISTAKSPQQMMGTVVKHIIGKKYLGIDNPAELYHVAIMPCYDKKLEASRKDFYDELYDTRDVDTVLSTKEIIELLESEGFAHLSQVGDSKADKDGDISMEEEPLTEAEDQSGSEEELTDLEKELTAMSEDGQRLIGATEEAGGSGGYLEHIFRYAAKKLYNVEINGPLPYETKRNSDLKEVNLTVDGEVKLRFALAYGFRNIQGVLTKIRRNRCDYDFVEIMACPSGCVNGGGQIRSTDKDSKETVKAVEKAFHERETRKPEENPFCVRLYRDETALLGGGPFSEAARKLLHTRYHSVPKLEMSNPLGIKW